MKTQTTLLILWMILVASSAFGQNNYPKIIKANSTQTIHAIQHDLWIITDSQMDSAISTGLTLRICDSLNVLYQTKIDKLKSKSIELKAINNTLQKGYNHYVEKWTVCNQNMESTQKKLVKQKRLKYIFGGTGLGIGIILALVLF